MENFVGVDIGCTKMLICANVNGQIVETRANTGLDCPKEKIKAEIEHFLTRLPFTPAGIGIALPGLVDGDHRVQFSDVSHLNDVETSYFSEDRFRVRFINDVKSATVAEMANYPHKDTLAVIMAGSGFAIGVVSKGKVFTGAHGFAGEMGHCPLPTPNGIKTVDELAGGMAILERAGCKIDEFLSRIQQGDPAAQNIIREAGTCFGISLSTILHLYNPDQVVIGGSTATYPGYLEAALETARQYTLQDIFDACAFAQPKDNRRIVALGAIEYVRSNFQL